jgi:hypothetical protein
MMRLRERAAETQAAEERGDKSEKPSFQVLVGAVRNAPSCPDKIKHSITDQRTFSPI